jgi:hypothetical protein
LGSYYFEYNFGYDYYNDDNIIMPSCQAGGAHTRFSSIIIVVELEARMKKL